MLAVLLAGSLLASRAVGGVAARSAAADPAVAAAAGFVNARLGAYATLQDALNDAQKRHAGLYIPAGTYTPSTTPSFTGELTVDTVGTVISGDGPLLTTLALTDRASRDRNLIHVRCAGVQITDLLLKGPYVSRTDPAAPETGPDAKDKGIGIYVYGPARNLYDVMLRDVYIQGTAGWSVKMTTDRGYGLYSNGIHACRFHSALSGGSLFYGGSAGATTLDVTGTTLNGPGSSFHGPDSLTRGAVHLDNATECSFVGCVFETPDASTALSMRGSGSHGFMNCHFELENGSAVFPLKRQWIITTSGFVQPCSFRNCYILRHQTTCGPRVLRTSAAGAILPFRFEDCYWRSNESAAATDDFDFGSPRDAVLLDNVTLTGHSGRSAPARSHAPGRYAFTSGDGGADAHHAAAGSLKVIAHP